MDLIEQGQLDHTLLEWYVPRDDEINPQMIRKILDKMIGGYLMNDRLIVGLIKWGIRVRLRRDILGDCL